MNRYFINLVRLSVKSIVRISKKLPSFVESDMKLLQGKGWGAATVDFEAWEGLRFLKESGIQNPIVIDIGANVGNYSRAILRLAPTAQIYAFEPSAAARGELERLFVNDSRVSISAFALSSEKGSRILWSDFAGSGLTSLSQRRLDHFGIDFSHEEQVQVTTLDAWNVDHQLEPDLIKIDVEGHELDVLKGAGAILEFAKVVQFEFGGCNIDSRTFFQDFWYFFQSIGFRIFRITPSGATEVTSYNEDDEYFRTTNYLAVRERAQDQKLNFLA